ncbi:MAG: hypothetical protein C6H99_01270 [Epsilonproteobacteria bacterium]|nr:hypothetical protein [Campylobacterota bacterium]NPA63602.1 hypothetical protein [Campylobacterota bacterium]
MEKVVLMLLPLILGAQILKHHCDRCHKSQIPYVMIYKRALLLYSSKERIKRNLTDFLVSPSADKSILPPGLKRRFDPAKHPKFSKEIAQKAIEELIEQEDIVKKFRTTTKKRTSAQVSSASTRQR